MSTEDWILEEMDRETDLAGHLAALTGGLTCVEGDEDLVATHGRRV